jgi:hypothetical protein
VRAKVLALLGLLFWAQPDLRLVRPAEIPTAPRSMPGPTDVLYAKQGDLNYSYGAAGAELNAVMTNAVSANIVVTYTGFDAAAQAAFQAAVNIWATTLSSPATIRINARYANLGAGILGNAGPARLCQPTIGGVANTYYAAALADKLQGSAFCAAVSPPIAFEINANLNSAFANWDFGTSGTPVAGKYNFMTVVLHEIGHGLGLYGSARASSRVTDNPCTASNPAAMFIGCYRSTPDIYDRFVLTGGGIPLLGFSSPSADLAGQLVANNMFFSGANARLANAGLNPKIETHNFNTFYGVSSADNGWQQGSSYSHLDDALYTGTANGLMTAFLNTAEVYTDPGPIVRGILRDQGWTLASPPPVARRGDFDGDGAADLVLFRPGNGNWTMRLSSANFATGPDLAFGLPTDKPVPGDYDGDGRTDMALYRPSNGIWYVIYSTTGALAQLQWGVETDVPMPADYTGDGRTDLCIWRPSTGEWFIFDLSRGTYTSRQWGISTDVPLTGDYDGDGLADVAVFRPSNGYWYVFFSSTQTYTVYQWGVSTDIPLPADYTGDGRIDIAVYRPSNGYWFVFDLTTGTYNTYQWGVSTDTPAPKDYDGDGRTDLAIWRPSTGTWFIYFLGSSSFQSVSHGASGDLPVR